MGIDSNFKPSGSFLARGANSTVPPKIHHFKSEVNKIKTKNTERKREREKEACC